MNLHDTTKTQSNGKECEVLKLCTILAFNDFREQPLHAIDYTASSLQDCVEPNVRVAGSDHTYY
jgi:hypothetical protein